MATKQAFPTPTPIQRPVYTERIVSLKGGQYDRDHPSLIPPFSYFRGINVELRGGGLFKTRRGSQKMVNSPGAGLAQGVFFFEPTEGNGVIVSAHAGNLYKWGFSGNVWNQIGALQLLNTKYPVNFVVSETSDGKRLFINAGNDDPGYYVDIAAGTDPVALGVTESDFPQGANMTSQSSRVLVVGNAELPDSVIIGPIARGVAHSGDGQWNHNLFNLALDTPGREKGQAIVKYRKDQALGFTRRSAHLILNLSDSNQDNWAVQVIDPNFGTEAPMSVVVAADDGFFLGTDKRYRSIKRSALSEVTGVDETISQYNTNLFERINQQAITKAAAVYFDEYILLAVPVDGSTENNLVIPIDMSYRIPSESGQSVIPIIVGEWTGWNVRQWVVANFQGKDRLFFQDNTDGSLHEALVGEVDTGDYPAWQVDFSGMKWGHPETMKTPMWGEFQYENSYGNVTVNYAGDNRTFQSTVLKGPTNIDAGHPTFPVTFPVTFGSPQTGRQKFYFYGQPRNRMIQMRLSGTGGYFNVRDLSVYAKGHNLNKRD